MMGCEQFEDLLADYIDGELAFPARAADRTAFLEHLSSCAACALLTEDAQSALAFMEKAADVEPPPMLAGRILEATNAGWEFRLRARGVRGWINRLFAPILKPRIVMGAMLTMMSLTMLTRCTGVPKKTITAADLDPVRLWSSLDERTHRLWERSVKSYESMRLVYEILAPSSTSGNSSRAKKRKRPPNRAPTAGSWISSPPPETRPETRTSRRRRNHELRQPSRSNRRRVLPRMREADVPGVPAAGAGFRVPARSMPPRPRHRPRPFPTCPGPPPVMRGSPYLRALRAPAPAVPGPALPGPGFALDRKPGSRIRTYTPSSPCSSASSPAWAAIYNGQYAKRPDLDAVIFGLLVSVESSTVSFGVHVFTGIMIAIGVIYMAFEAYHTARKRRHGIEVEEYSSLLDIRPAHGRFPVGAVVLILLGFVMLLDTTDIIGMDQLERYWPALLIVIGIYMLYTRLGLHAGDHTVNGEARR